MGSRGGASGCMLPTLELPLMDAAAAGDLDKVNQLISSGHNLNETDHGGWTPFIRACEHGHLEIAKILTAKGADIKADSGFHWTALMKASEGGHLEVVKWLVDQGMDVEECNNSDKHTALWLAVSQGHTAVCDFLVSKGANLAHVNRESTPLLIQACYMGRLESVKFLIQKGADPLTTVDKNYGNSAFLTACRWGHLEVVEWLATNVKGIDIHQINPYGTHAMSGALMNHSLPLAKLLIKLGWKLPQGAQSPVIGTENMELLKYFVETLGYPIDGATQYGSTALSYAAYNGNLEVVQYLVSQGADPFKKSTDDQSALDVAIKARSKPKVEAVVKYFESLQK